MLLLLIGQFWNIPIESKLIQDDVYNVTIKPANSSPRSVLAEIFERTWDNTPETCLYMGNAQGGSAEDSVFDSVIQGTYKDYIVNDMFETNFVYEEWESDCTPDSR